MVIECAKKESRLSKCEVLCKGAGGDKNVQRNILEDLLVDNESFYFIAVQ